MIIGEYESSLREQAVAARRRLFGSGTPLPRTVLITRAYAPQPIELAPPPEPVTEPHEYLVVASAVPPAMAWRRVALEVCAKHSITEAQLSGFGRQKNVVKARDEAAYRMTRELGMSLMQTARRLNRDHTTVLYAVRKYVKMLGAMAE